MGLDNLPHVYPCERAGTAVMTEPDEQGSQRIDCDATIAAHQCPWANAYPERQGIASISMMFGTPCWFRGKTGNWMLSVVQGYDPPEDGFYGTGRQEEEGPHLSPDYCNELAAWMEEHIEAYAQEVAKTEAVSGPEDMQNAIDSYRYAAWWLRFVAEKAEGSDVWY